MKAYRLVLHDGDGQRIATSPTRVLCAYEPGRPGWVSAAAVNVEDPDEWRWDVFGDPHEPDDDDDDPINRPGEGAGALWWI
jgi:hypothetical protein